MKVSVKKEVKVIFELNDEESEIITKIIQMAITASQDKYMHLSSPDLEWCRELWTKIDKCLEYKGYIEEIGD